MFNGNGFLIVVLRNFCVYLMVFQMCLENVVIRVMMMFHGCFEGFQG